VPAPKRSTEVNTVQYQSRAEKIFQLAPWRVFTAQPPAEDLPKKGTTVLSSSRANDVVVD
jgi:hypothetical protein